MTNLELVTAAWRSFKGTNALIAEVRSRAARGVFKTEFDCGKLRGFFTHLNKESKDLQLRYDLLTLLVNQFDDGKEAKALLEEMKSSLIEYQELFAVMEDSLDN